MSLSASSLLFLISKKGSPFQQKTLGYFFEKPRDIFDTNTQQTLLLLGISLHKQTTIDTHSFPQMIFSIDHTCFVAEKALENRSYLEGYLYQNGNWHKTVRSIEELNHNLQYSVFVTIGKPKKPSAHSHGITLLWVLKLIYFLFFIAFSLLLTTAFFYSPIINTYALLMAILFLIAGILTLFIENYVNHKYSQAVYTSIESLIYNSWGSWIINNQYTPANKRFEMMDLFMKPHFYRAYNMWSTYWLSLLFVLTLSFFDIVYGLIALVYWLFVSIVFQYYLKKITPTLYRLIAGTLALKESTRHILESMQTLFMYGSKFAFIQKKYQIAQRTSRLTAPYAKATHNTTTTVVILSLLMVLAIGFPAFYNAKIHFLTTGGGLSILLLTAILITLMLLTSSRIYSYVVGKYTLDLLYNIQAHTQETHYEKAPNIFPITLHKVALSKTNTNDLLSLKIHSGERILILGKIGSGKSTLLSYIAGYTSPHTGTILTAQQKSTSYLWHYASTSVAFFNQDMTKYIIGSVKDNLNMGVHFTDQDIANAFHTLQIDIPLQRNMRTLTDGEKQIVSLARLLLWDRHLLVLDDPTQHLDWNRQQAFIHWLISRPEDHTIVVVSQNESFLPFANRIIVLENHRIVMDVKNSNVYNQSTTQ